MTQFATTKHYLPFVKRYRFRVALHIAIFWVFLDLLYVLMDIEKAGNTASYFTRSNLFVRATLLRELIVFICSFFIAFLLLAKVTGRLRLMSLWAIALIKTLALMVCALIMNFIIHFSYFTIFVAQPWDQALLMFFTDALDSKWLLHKIPYLLITFLLTQLIIEINEKYAPGVFKDILLGKYIHPKTESRIVMFMDLKDSTPIAERLGHESYFRFIREFISNVSLAVTEYGGRIYQYVGDEIVVSWIATQGNARKCMASLLEARKNIQKKSEMYRRLYNTVPEFRVGIHTGDVTVGEIGVIKKDLAMSGDTMNTTARIRSACSELNEKFIISKEFKELIELEDWQAVSLGDVELKGKEHGVELYALKV